MTTMTPHPALRRRDTPAQLCQLVRDWAGRIPTGGAIVEEKKDGIRFLWIDGEAVTREGTLIEGVEHIAEVLRAIEHEQCVPMFFDGEFEVAGSFEATQRHFQARGRNGDDGVLWLYDAVPMREWRRQQSGLTLEVRRRRVDEMVAPFAAGPVKSLPWTRANTIEEIEQAGRNAIARGAEGVVAKHALATYRRNASTWWRIKRKATFDLRVIGVVPHAAGDRLGGLVCDDKGVAVTVTQGFTEDQRKQLWAIRERVIGSVVELSAMERTARGSMRHARYARQRLDKGGE